MPGRNAAVRWLRYQWPAIVVLLAGLGATAVVTAELARATVAKDAVRFETAANRVEHEITRRFNTYIAMLRAGAGLLSIEGDISNAEFQTFVQRLELERRYPGIQGMGWSRRLAADELPRFVAQYRQRENAAFRVWPDHPRDEYHTIVYLAPLDRRNQVAIGFDMFTDPTRRGAMERARDAAEPAATGIVSLKQEIDPDELQPGFLIYAPVYDQGIPPTLAGRRAQLRGFVFAPFRAGDLLRGIFGTGAAPLVAFELFDGRAAPENLVYRTASYSARGRFRTTREVDVAGRPWLLTIHDTPNLDRASAREFIPGAVAAGVTLTLMLTALTIMQTRARRAMEESRAEIQRLLESERAMRAEAERVNRLKDEFLATLSHELRTPLNAIVGWSQLMADPAMPDDARRKALITVQRNAQMQAQLIGDLLDMSRIVSGKVRLEMDAVDLGDVLEAALNVVRPTAAAKGLQLDVTVQSGAVVRGDAARLQQVLWNLLNNAMKFTPPEGRVHVEVRSSGPAIELAVSDTGIGIHPEFLPYVFDRFRQGDGSTTRQHGGLGLGLSIVKSLVEMHGGTVRAASEGPGCGSTFTLALPAYTRSAEQTPHSGEAAPGTTRGALAGVRILVVDDEADARDLLAFVLQRHGAVLTMAASAEEALGAIQQAPAPFDLILSDLGMPSIDGFEFLRHVRALPGGAYAGVPAIAVSAYARDEDRQSAHRAGYGEHITKPFDADQLVSACVEALEKAA